MEHVSISSLTPKELEFIENIKKDAYGPNTCNYYTSLACRPDSIVATYALPFLVRADHNPKEADNLINNMFAGLNETIKPQFIFGYSAPLDIVSGQTKLTQISCELNCYYELEYSHKFTIKIQEDEAEKLRRENELATEQGQLCVIRGKSYYVDKCGVVFEANPNPSHFKGSRMTPAMIMGLKGKYCFNSVSEAQAYLTAHDEAQIIAEDQRVWLKKNV